VLESWLALSLSSMGCRANDDDDKANQDPSTDPIWLSYSNLLINNKKQKKIETHGIIHVVSIHFFSFFTL